MNDLVAILEQRVQDHDKTIPVLINTIRVLHERVTTLEAQAAQNDQPKNKLGFI